MHDIRYWYGITLLFAAFLTKVSESLTESSNKKPIYQKVNNLTNYQNALLFRSTSQYPYYFVL